MRVGRHSVVHIRFNFALIVSNVALVIFIVALVIFIVGLLIFMVILAIFTFAARYVVFRIFQIFNVGFLVDGTRPVLVGLQLLQVIGSIVSDSPLVQ